MLEIEGFEKFEMEPCLVMLPKDSQTSTLQRWRVPSRNQAEELFTLVLAETDGDKNAGTKAIVPRGDGTFDVALVWRSRQSVLRAMMWEKLAEAGLSSETIEECIRIASKHDKCSISVKETEPGKAVIDFEWRDGDALELAPATLDGRGTVQPAMSMS